MGPEPGTSSAEVFRVVPPPMTPVPVVGAMPLAVPDATATPGTDVGYAESGVAGTMGDVLIAGSLGRKPCVAV